MTHGGRYGVRLLAVFITTHTLRHYTLKQGERVGCSHACPPLSPFPNPFHTPATVTKSA